MAHHSAPTASIPWRWIAIGVAAVLSTALITGVVVANYRGGASDPQVAPQPVPPVVNVAPVPPKRVAQRSGDAPSQERARPSLADIDECNRSANTAPDTTTNTLKDALVGAAGGAGLGAAGGAIAGGGRGAGKGAGIGALVGAAAGTLYGLNDAHKNDATAEAAYRACMRRRGYSD